MLVLVSADDGSPDRAADLANEVVFQYKSQNIDYRRTVTQDANTELREMVDKYRVTKEESDQKLLEYERSHAIGSFSSRKQALEDRLKLLSDRQGQLLVKRSDLEARLARVKKIEHEGDGFSLPLDVILTSPLIGQLKSKYLELRDQRTALLSHYGEKYDKVTALDEQMKGIADALHREIKTQLDAIRGDYDEVVGNLKQIQARVEEANSDLSELAAMQVDSTSWRSGRRTPARCTTRSGRASWRSTCRRRSRRTTSASTSWRRSRPSR
jgi:uncharacterized protein involved in exopolysaccharide biosynthesis